MGTLVATCVWRISPELVAALDEHLGPPVDSYVNGSQTWFTDDGPGDATLEWRLHPVAGYRAPAGLSHYDLWEHVVSQLATGSPDRLHLGREERALGSLWDGLECYAAFDDELEPATLARAATDAVGRAPDAAGLADHDRIGDEWERSGGRISIVDQLLGQLGSS
ncbi:MAG: hypothetical protein M5U14_18085 [Acidimicrobiia bacterium]|nr:hypothetical protein [Acidimicrobiia bacterium]